MLLPLLLAMMLDTSQTTCSATVASGTLCSATTGAICSCAGTAGTGGFGTPVTPPAGGDRILLEDDSLLMLEDETSVFLKES